MKKKVSVKEPVRLRSKELSGGSLSLYLDTYYKGKRSYEFLHLYIVQGADPMSKMLNADAMKKANMKKAQRIMELTSGGDVVKSDELSKITVLDLMEQYSRHKQQAGHDGMPDLIHRTEKYIKAYSAGGVLLRDVDKSYCLGFINYLKAAETSGKHLSSFTQSNYYTCFHAALNYAVKEGIIKFNPCDRISADSKIRKEESTRGYLTVDELKTLMATPCRSEATKAAYLFACFCGLRYSDVIRLRWQDIERDGEQTRVMLVMKKTKQPIYLPLSGEALKWMPERKAIAGDSDEVFKLPGISYMDRVLRGWVAENGIQKRITFHTSRHTFATVMLAQGVDLYTVSKLLGHTNIATTQIYAKIVDKSKDDAVNRMSDLFNQ